MIGYDLNVIERGIRGIFGREFITRQRKARYPMFATIIESDKQEEKFNAISTLPQLTEMTDERVLAGFSEYSYTLKNKVFATGIKVPRTIFDFDQTGQLRTLVQSMSSRVANFPDKLIMQTIGANGTGYDSQTFFGAAHDLGSGTAQDNDLASGMTNTILASVTADNRDAAIAAFQQDLRLAKAKLLEFVDDRGEPWHEDAEPEGLVILCHPRAEMFVRTALEASLISNTTNISARSVSRVITTNYPQPFTSSGVLYYGTWYLMKVDTPIQPFLFQRFGPKTTFPDTIPEEDHEVLKALNAIEIQTVMRQGRDIDAHTFFDDEYLFGARCVYNAGYGMWQNVVRVLGSA